jgi:hypothetical protein
VHRTYLCYDLHLLALAVLGFRDGSLETLEELIVEFLHGSKSVHVKVSSNSSETEGRPPLSYRSTRNNQFNLSPMRTHELLEVVTDALQYPQSVVLGQSLQEVFYCAGLVRAAGVLFQLSHDLGFVALS